MKLPVWRLFGVALLAALAVNLGLASQPSLDAVRALPASAWFLLAIMGLVATLGGYAAWFIVIRESDVSFVSLTIFVQPIVGVPLAA